MKRLLSLALSFAIVGIGVYGALALWYHPPFASLVTVGAAMRYVPLGLWLLVMLLVAWRALRPAADPARRRLDMAFSAALIGFFFGWWSTIQPSGARDWSMDVSRPATATLEGDSLVVRNVRDFDWRSETDFTPRWETRRYDLAKLSSLDLIADYWMGEPIAHIMMSFGFSDGQYLLWSIEVRRTRAQHFSVVAGFFRSSELIYLAADERDALRLRAKIRGEDLRIYRVRTSPEKIRAMLLAYVDEANTLAAQPAWYNTITSNCTTMIFKMAKLTGSKIPLDWRVLASGFFPDYAYAQGLIDTNLPMDVLRERSKISPTALRSDELLQPDYSRALREGLPGTATPKP
jgi:hypothetical protein